MFPQKRNKLSKHTVRLLGTGRTQWTTYYWRRQRASQAFQVQLMATQETARLHKSQHVAPHANVHSGDTTYDALKNVPHTQKWFTMVCFLVKVFPHARQWYTRVPPLAGAKKTCDTLCAFLRDAVCLPRCGKQVLGVVIVFFTVPSLPFVTVLSSNICFHFPFVLIFDSSRVLHGKIQGVRNKTAKTCPERFPCHSLHLIVCIYIYILKKMKES